MNDSVAESYCTAAPSDLVGASPKPVNRTSSSNALSEFSVSNKGKKY